MILGRELRKRFPLLAELVATLHHRSYVSDGLITRRNADFLHDPRFSRAYQTGRSTDSWGLTQPSWRVHTALWAASHAATLPGDFVECGVNRGGMALAIMEYLEFNSLGKKFFLLDTYRGFPEHTISSSANQGQYQECYEDVVRIFAPYPRAIVIRGVIPDTLTRITSQQISYLSIDLNCAEPEIMAFRYLWPRLSPGGVVLLDDYANGPAYQRQKDALDSVSRELNFPILTLPTGQGMIVK
jgi:hypothetical protein